MKSKIYREYINKDYLQKTILLGDLFGTPIRNIDARTRENKPYRIYFTDGKKVQGFIDERVREGLPEKYLELKTPIGKLKGDFCHTLDPSIHFSFAVQGNPYDTISGFYNASLFSCFSENLRIGQSVKCSLEKDQEILQTIEFDSNIELEQCYKNSPEPYERLIIRTGGVSDFSVLHEKDFDKYNRSMLTKSKILQRDSVIRMVEPVLFTTECSKKRENPYSFDYANIDLDQIYNILAEYDDGIPSCLEHFHKLLTFENLDLYQNMVYACFPNMDSSTSSLVTGVEKVPYQKNLALVSRLNAQKQ